LTLPSVSVASDCLGSFTFSEDGSMKADKKTTKAAKVTTVATKASAKAPKAKAAPKATKAKKDGLTGASLRKAVKASLDAKAKIDDPTMAVNAIEVVDVTHEVMGAIEAATPAKGKGKKAKAAPAPVVVVEATPAEVNPVDATPVDAETKAADAVYAYAEKLGIDTADVPRIAKACGEADMLAGLAGMEITDRVVWLASQKAREFDNRVVKPHRPSTGLGRVTKAKRTVAGTGDGSEASTGKARVVVFGHAATAVIRALRATCSMGFAQIRNVLDAMGASSVADATIRAQMAGGGLTRGEPAELSAEQVEQAKQASQAVAVAC
jgi:hypothetical protein